MFLERPVSLLSEQEFRDHFHIPDNIPILLIDDEALSSVDLPNNMMYFSKEQFIAGLRLPIPLSSSSSFIYARRAGTPCRVVDKASFTYSNKLFEINAFEWAPKVLLTPPPSSLSSPSASSSSSSPSSSSSNGKPKAWVVQVVSLIICDEEKEEDMASNLRVGFRERQHKGLSKSIIVNPTPSKKACSKPTSASALVSVPSDYCYSLHP
ncbi:hypothetical protein CK203_065654 [Vitis vinifera]|uniref:Uncharacterized protein n=1 Tax=Vitis vinifera TaxID=29760 RepID=A0A438FNM3_VITVI|nr:hypothetical protein CK203_065654 [Vitis vinifera]